VASVTRARVRHSSNMGPIFNAMTPIKRGISINATHPLSMLSTPARSDHLNAKTCSA